MTRVVEIVLHNIIKEQYKKLKTKLASVVIKFPGQLIFIIVTLFSNWQHILGKKDSVKT